MAAATISTRHSTYYGQDASYRNHRDYERQGQGQLVDESTFSSRNVGGSKVVAGAGRPHMPPRSPSGSSCSKLSGYSVKKEQSTRSNGKSK